MTEQLKRVGRPPGKQQPHKISVYLDDEDLAHVEAQARAQDRTVSYVIRQLIRQDARKRANDFPAEEQERREQQVTSMREKRDATDDPAERITMGKAIAEE